VEDFASAGSLKGNCMDPVSDDINKKALITIHADVDKTLSYASYQNNVPLIRKLRIVNDSSDVILNVDVEVACEPAFADVVRLRFERLNPGEERSLIIDSKFSHRYLAQLDEAERGRLRISVSSDDEILGREDYPVDLLAYNQWGGTRALPELLAAFSMPNNPAVDKIMARAAEALSSSAAGTTLCAYQSKSREDVWAQIAALYASVGALRLHYAEPPASFGTQGQKIRTPDQIVSGGMATCLDLAMLMSSCLEQAGLNPLILIKNGHAWVGCWLIDTMLPVAVLDDCQALRKRVSSGELLVFETTVLARHPVMSLKLACEAGYEHLTQDAEFLFAVDIARARMAQIRPLPSRLNGVAPELDDLEVEGAEGAEGSQKPVDGSSAALRIEVPPMFPALDVENIMLDQNAEMPTTAAGRLAHWKSKLLDLTLRNRLLNFKATKVMLPLAIDTPSALEDSLAAGTGWQFKAVPPLMDGNDIRVGQVARQRTGIDPMKAAAAQAFDKGELPVFMDAKKLESYLLDIHAAARTGLEEGGANTLYLVIGMLKWTEDERSEKSYQAPILLIPVSLTRKTVRDGYTLRRHDDETIVNPTLVQMLQDRFDLTLPALGALPTDDSGVDVQRIMQIFRLATNSIPRWEILDQTWLGIFSFTKYLMWKDLADRAQDLMRNRVVSHLIERPHESFSTVDDLDERRDMDERHAPDALLTPMLADSSQLNAISRAGAGHDFVLEGPPGTGKSQTITNLIAHFLGTGKTVLFVSEKMAALDVVQRRLNDIGLGPFCLQLHSAKAKKSEVIDQLRGAMNAAAAGSPEHWAEETARITRLRGELNGLVKALHTKYPNGLTVFEATGTAIRDQQWKPAKLPWTSPEQHDRAAMLALRELISSIQVNLLALGSPSNHPLAAIRQTRWSNAWEDSLFAATDNLNTALTDLQRITDEVDLIAAIGLGAPSAQLYEALTPLIDALLESTSVPAGLLAVSPESAQTHLHALHKHGVRRTEAWAALEGFGFSESVRAIDGASIAKQWAQASGTWWPKRILVQRTVLGHLMTQRSSGKRPAPEDMAAILDKLIILNEEDTTLASLAGMSQQLISDGYSEIKKESGLIVSPRFTAEKIDQARQLGLRLSPLAMDLTSLAGISQQLIGEACRDIKTDWAIIAAYEARLAVLDHEIGAFSTIAGLGETAEKVAYVKRLRRLVIEHRAKLMPQGDLCRKLAALKDALRVVKESTAEVENLIDAVGDSALIENPSAPAMVSRLLQQMSTWSLHRRSVRPWCRWRDQQQQATAHGIDKVLQAVIDGQIDVADLSAYAEYSYRVWWLKAVTDREPILRDFSSADHMRKIIDFREAETRFQSLTQQYVVATLAGKVPRVVKGDKPDVEMALVMREMQVSRGHTPVRKLVQGLPTLLPKLKPCLLMSPLSVAQYLDASMSHFDLVIFDEASQILVWDAVGAIARGKQLVVVGDPKQLPPTSFFARGDAGEGDGDGIDIDDSEQQVKDLDSILDECMGAGMPTLRLEWHYRSRHESLITFSNQRYYESRLITFPSPITDDRAVNLIMVNGLYDRGGSRTNRAEADAIIEAIVAHFHDESRRHLTVGVVTFNQTQQRLIESLLEEAMRSDPELESLIAEHGSERMFIKNLENVQGDERDLIFFSIAYGRDAAGRMPMNFGPLNKDGGQRRLNVAITRARVGVTIFSSIRSEDIDVSKTRAAGVVDLKNYLEFAVKGARALAEQATHTGLEPDSPFEVEVITALRDKGWTVHPQVGCSGFRIDIGVVHPDHPGTYLVGVECDGATYHSIPTARDRDRLRQHVLEGLGWTILRIWSTDWWADREGEMVKIEAALITAINVALSREQSKAQSAETSEDINAAA
jgi:hypothetical protein